MRAYLLLSALVQSLVVLPSVGGFSLSNLVSEIVPLSISTSNTAQEFDGWGTSLAWFAEYVGNLEGSTAALRQCSVNLFSHV